MLRPDEVSTMRSTILESLPDVAQIQRRTLTPDGLGGFTETWSTITTTVCRVAPGGRSAEERIIADRLTVASVWTVTLPALTEVQPVDRIVVGTRIFEVVSVLERSTELARRVVCTEIV